MMKVIGWGLIALVFAAAAALTGWSIFALLGVVPSGFGADKPRLSATTADA